MSELYRAIAGSPITYLATDVSAGQTTIAVTDDSVLPDAPNICTIGYGENIETIRYGAKSNGVLQEVTRGIEGTPRAWQSGTEVARFYTAYDHNRIIDNITQAYNDLMTHKAETATDDVHGLAWNEPMLLTLQNGWTGSVYLAINPGLRLAKIYGSMQPGTTNAGTVITSLPSSAYPENYVAVPVYSGGQGASYLGIYINDSGNMAIRQPLSTISNLGTLLFNTLFSF